MLILKHHSQPIGNEIKWNYFTLNIFKMTTNDEKKKMKKEKNNNRPAIKWPIYFR